MESFLATWYCSIVPALIAAVMQWISVSKQKQIMAELGGRITSSRDLRPVREAINLSMILAVVYMVLYGGLGLVLVLLMLSGFFSPLVMGAHLLVFGVITLPIGLWAKTVENRFKAMEVSPDEPDLLETFQRYLKQWNEPRLRLPNE
jgi:hypothetical protein